MIIDAHCHAWEHWPYRPPVPDLQSRGRVEQLLWEMDRSGVDRAVLVCARIGDNAGNNDYGARCAAEHPDRLVQFADVDSSWSRTYHRPGAAARLAAVVQRYRLKGFTHYLRDDPEWLTSEAGLAFWTRAADLNLIASIALSPDWQPALRQLAARFPTLTFLCHHMAGARADDSAGLDEIVASAVCPNVWLKLSGFHYVASRPWDFPHADAKAVARRLYEAFGPNRLCWGSDYPVVRFYMTYQQSLEVVRAHCEFIPADEQDMILGGNMGRLLAEAGR